MKKYIWTIAVCIMIAGVTTVVACRKDNENNLDSQYTAYSTKGGTTINQLRNVMVAYYAACDSAYQADSTAFLSACANNDTTNFLNVTGLSYEMLISYQSLALAENDNYLNSNPGLKKEITPCVSCQENALSLLGNLASQTQGHLTALIPKSTIGMDRDRLNHIIYACRCSNPSIMVACISSSLGYLAKQQLDLMLDDFWQHCDSAYVNSPALLQKACEENNLEQFYRLTNLSQSFFDDLIGLANISYSEFLQNNPNNEFNEAPCSACLQSSLPEIWYHIDDIHMVSAEIKKYAPDYFDTILHMLPPIDPCIKWCSQVQPRDPDRDKWCYLNCTMETNLLKIQQVLMMFEYDATH